MVRAKGLMERVSLVKRVTMKKVPMPKGKREMRAVKAPGASRQIMFRQLLVAARKTYLMDSLSQALHTIAPRRLKTEIGKYVPQEAQRILAAAGIRDEHVFPTPLILKAKPTLVGYYRLLLGSPQKSF